MKNVLIAQYWIFPDQLTERSIERETTNKKINPKYKAKVYFLSEKVLKHHHKWHIFLKGGVIGKYANEENVNIHERDNLVIVISDKETRPGFRASRISERESMKT
ncbi:hypothetical protein P5673_003202 [Acropora cervicornis]|uniref:Uncharacterized protein n=1 Tax=Acropora cervicornis TaxID=6130 RepID=A0AAD9VER6_ACRCE|nr:hypothetical protein P5673_003202 [Acropora cervicornis]